MRLHESIDFAERDLGGPIMEFRLTYRGPLYADRGPDDGRQSRLRHIQSIRSHFHEQLSELWKVDHRLNSLAAQREEIAKEGGRTTKAIRAR